MLKVEALIKHLSENNSQASPARQVLLNYLSFLVGPEDLVTVDLIESFFAVCLDYAHWQQNRNQLRDEVLQLLEGHVDFTDFKWPTETQIVEIENLSDLTDALQVYLNALHKKGEKYRLLVGADKKIQAVVLHADHSLTLRCFDKKMVIHHGQLEPLKKDYALYYTPDLELDPTQIQKLELAPFVTAQFQIQSEGLRGSLTRGYLCQKFFDLQGENIATYPKLFFAIKRLEQSFINRQTDPFYKQTISSLERVIDSLRLGDPEAFEESMDVLAQAQNAYEAVFHGDKLLGLLIRDLQHTLSLRRDSSKSRVVRTPQKVEEPWNQKSTAPLFPKRERKSDLTN